MPEVKSEPLGGCIEISDQKTRPYSVSDPEERRRKKSDGEFSKCERIKHIKIEKLWKTRSDGILTFWEKEASAHI